MRVFINKTKSNRSPNLFLGGMRFALVPLLLMSLSLAASGNAAELSTQDLVAGQKLYHNRCAKCHKMYDPAKYSPQQWDAWMEKMGRKARLKPAQKEAVAQYVANALRQPAKGAEKGPGPIPQQ